MITAMKAGETLRVSTFRMLLSEFNYKNIDLQRELTDEDAMGVIQKEVKKRREAIESFTAGGRTEQAEKEKQELAILQTYLPEMMTEEQITARVKELNLPKDFAQAMRIAAPEFKGKAEGKMVAEAVKQWLSS